MKKFKFILPVLAFVMAITLAFAVPTEVDTAYDVETSSLPFVAAVYPNTHPTEGCESCGNAIGTDCIVGGAGEPCKCQNNQNFNAHEPVSCDLLREKE